MTPPNDVVNDEKYCGAFLVGDCLGVVALFIDGFR